MFNQLDVRQLFLNNLVVRNEWRELLIKGKINQFSDDDYELLDMTIGLYYQDELIGTASYQKNIIKYVVVCEKYKDGGRTFNVLISAIMQEMSIQHIFHYQVVTKNTYQKSFEYLGFKTIAKTDKMVFLENGDVSIHDFLTAIPKLKGEKIAAIVMNANPFTKGHLYLVEQAAKENDGVYIFVLEKEQALFSSQERLDLVKAGIKKIANTEAVFGGSYVVSPSTFPSYFLKKDDKAAKEQMKLDAVIFKEHVAPALNITVRYLGDEPLSEMTNTYNKILKESLSPDIRVTILPRKRTKTNKIISATQVRRAFLSHQLKRIKDFVPETTYLYLKNKEKKEQLQWN